MKNTYTPRRASKRWLSGAPDHLLDLFYHKNSGKWEAFYTGKSLIPQEGRTFANCYVSGREMSEFPSHPQGVGCSIELKAHEMAAYRYRVGHKRVTWDSLPETVKDCIRRDGSEI